jgi:hypothetical protein
MVVATGDDAIGDADKNVSIPFVSDTGEDASGINELISL